MDVQAMMSNLSRLGRVREREVVERKLRGLARGRGGTLLVECRQEAGENLLLRSIMRETKTPCYHGVCQPYPFLEPCEVFAQNFAKFFAQFRLQSLHGYSEAFSALDTPAYKGPWSKISRKVTRKKTKAPPLSYAPYLLHSKFARLLHEKLPCVVFFEDIHWADLATFKLLLFLLHAFRDQPILFIFTANPEILDSPALPYELRDADVPVIQKLQAVQLVGMLPLSSKGRREYIDEIAMLADETIFFGPLEDGILTKVAKKVIGSALPDYLLQRLIALCRGNVYFLGQALLYLLDNVLAVKGRGWQLQCEAYEVDLPEYIEVMLEANFEKLSPASLGALRYAAAFGSIVPLELWEQISGVKDIGKIFDDCCRLGIMQPSLSEEAAIFTSYKQRDVALQSLPHEDRRLLHHRWAEFLDPQDISFARIAYHKRHGDPHSTSTLESMLNAGMAAERMLAYEEAYLFYREAAEACPEIKDAFVASFQELLQNMQNKERNPRVYFHEFMEGFRYYRIAALVAGESLLGDRERQLLKKIVYKDTPNRFYPTFGPLLMFLLKVVKRDKKAYPQDDLLFLLELVGKDIIPGNDYRRCLLFWEEIALHKPIPAKQRKTIVKYYEKWGNAEKHPLKKCQLYLSASFFARHLEDYFEAARLLHKTVKICRCERDEETALDYYQVEALRNLGLVYEKRALVEKEEEKKLHMAIQATYSYLDTVNRLWEIKDASWLAQHLMERCFNVCEAYSLENEVVIETLNNCKIKREHKEENEFSGKALIVVDNEDLGCADLLEEMAFEEGFFVEIEQIPPQDFTIDKKVPGYRCSFLALTPYSACWKNAIESLRASLSFDEKKPGGGWSVYESKEHTCFVLTGDHPGELYHTVLEFCFEKVTRRYL